MELYTRGIGTSRGSIYKERNTPSRRVLRFMHHFYSTNYTYIIYHLFITFLASPKQMKLEKVGRHTFADTALSGTGHT